MKPCPYCGRVLDLKGVRVGRVSTVAVLFLSCGTCGRGYTVALQGTPFDELGSWPLPARMGHLLELARDMALPDDLDNPFVLKG